MSLLRQARPLERREWSPSWLDAVLRRRPSSVPPVTDSRALQLTTCYSCIDLISGSFVQMPVGAFEGDGPARIPLTTDPDFLVTPTGATVLWPEWIGQALVSYLMRGNTYGEVLEVRRGVPQQIQLLHPDEVKVWFDKEAGGPRYRIPGVDEPQQRWPLGRIWHVKAMSLPGISASIVGLNPLQKAALTIGTALGAEEFGSNYFAQATEPSGVLSTDQDLDDDEAQDLLARWKKQHGKGSRDPAVLSSGLKWESLSIKPEEAQFLATIKAKRLEVAGFYRVPPHMIGIVDVSTSWGSGLEEQSLVYITYTLGQPIVRFETALSSLLPRAQYVKFNVAGLLRGRLSERYRAYLMGRQGGWLSINDILALEDLPPIGPEGDEHIQPLNFGTIPIDPTQPELPPPPVTDEGE